MLFSGCCNCNYVSVCSFTVKPDSCLSIGWCSQQMMCSLNMFNPVVPLQDIFQLNQLNINGASPGIHTNKEIIFANGLLECNKLSVCEVHHFFVRFPWIFPTGWSSSWCRKTIQHVGLPLDLGSSY